MKKKKITTNFFFSSVGRYIWKNRNKSDQREIETHRSEVLPRTPIIDVSMQLTSSVPSGAITTSSLSE